MIRIFICYRRQDSAGYAGRLFDHLRIHYGDSSVFMDVVRIEAGMDFIEAIDQAIGSCDAVLAVIGREWLTCGDGLKRRIDDPNDFIHLELTTAINRNVPIIPVLVGGVQPPSASELPSDLKALASNQEFELRDSCWESDVSRLIAQFDSVGSQVSLLPNTSITRGRRIIHAATIFVAIAVTAITSFGILRPQPPAKHSEVIPVQHIPALESVATLQLPRGSSQGVQILALLSGDLLTSVSEEEITLWSLSENKLEASFKISDYLMAATKLPDGKLALGNRDGTIAIWNPKTSKTEFTLKGHSGGVTTLAAMPNGRLASGGWDKTVKIWDIGTAEIQATLEGHTNHVRALAVLADGRLVSGSADGTIKLWNLETSNITVKTFKDRDKPVNALAVLADTQLASGAEDGVITLWNLTTGKVEARLVEHRDWINALVALSNGHLVSASDDANIIVWDLTKKKPDAILKGHQAKVTSLELLADGRLASASEDGVIKLWDISSHL